MRLQAIKLAGFKSFVDPTTVPFPSNLCAVVGPNGCGKSNIIDAVRWVMGESSAKTLRGESMTDVIFNGSNTRKPVGQASIELLFDNTEGRLTGEYAAYNEISVKRQVTRDGQSNYFLNNQKCRRKDITDLFLGTGLGTPEPPTGSPRSANGRRKPVNDAAAHHPRRQDLPDPLKLRRAYPGAQPETTPGKRLRAALAGGTNPACGAADSGRPSTPRESGRAEPGLRRAPRRGPAGARDRHGAPGLRNPEPRRPRKRDCVTAR